MIPKKIHYCWFGNGKLPEKDLKCIESWKKYCPDYEIIQWNEKNYDIEKNRYMKEAYDEGKYGFVPDYARLDIIYNHGGIYLDTDVELLKSLDSLLDNSGFAGFESIDSNKKFIALGLGFGAEKGNKIIKKMRDDYENIPFKLNDEKLNLIPSPTYSTRVLSNLGLKRNGMLQEIDGFVFLPEDYLCPLSCVTNKLNITENTISIHHYNGSWLTKKDRKRNYYVNKYKKIFGKKLGYYMGSLIYYVKEEGSIKTLKKIFRIK